MIRIYVIALFILASVSCHNVSNSTNKKADDSLVSEKKGLTFLPSPADSSSAEPYLFSDKNGVVYLSWIEKRDAENLLRFSILNNNTWSKPLTISSGNNWFVNWADYPQLASDGAKNMIAHFLEKSEKGKYTYDVKVLYSIDDGKKWSSPKILHDDGTKAEHGFVSIVPYQDNFFISWLDGRNTVVEAGNANTHEGHHGQMTLRGAIVDKQGKKLNEWELDNRVCDCCQTSASVTANGPIVVYRDRSENEIRDISIARLVNGQWTKPEPVFSDDWNINGCPVNGPRSDAEGNHLVVAWFSSPDKNAQVNISFSGNGGKNFDPPIRISEEKPIGRVDVVLLDSQTAMVSWMEGAVIKAAKVHSDGRKELSTIIAESSASRSSGFPQMTRSGNTMIFAWTDDFSKSIKVARLAL